jgi:hypothetical protein
MKVERIQLPTSVVSPGPSDGARVSAANDAPEKKRNGRQMQQEAQGDEAHTEGEPVAHSTAADGPQPAGVPQKHLLDITA